MSAGSSAVEPAGTLRFPQFDQCFPAAIDGAGVAIGVLPHITQQLRDGALCMPFGPESIAHRGDFFIVLRRDAAASEAVKQFVGWLRLEAAFDLDLVPGRTPLTRSPPASMHPRRAPRQARRDG